MKTFNVFLMALVFAFNAFAADALTEKLQRGLFEEEANHNLDAAIKEYQAVVTQSDEQRKVMATALFRLGECYRKLGRKNEANAHYQRILRDFSDQEQLVKLAGGYVNPPAPAAASQTELGRQLEARLAALRIQSITQRIEVDRLKRMSRDELLKSDAVKGDSRLMALRTSAFELEQKIAALDQLADDHPHVKAIRAQQKVVALQIDDALSGIVASAKSRAESLEEQVKTVATELQKVEAAQTPNAGTATTTGLTQAEGEALARAKTLARNSPDLLQSPTRDGLGELQLGARDGFYSVVDFILAQGVSANGPERGTPPIVLAAKGGHLRIVQLLLDKGADVNAMGAGNTALMAACENGYRAVVDVLLHRGADVNRSGTGTALTKAAAKGYAGLVELLLQRGATPDALNMISGVQGTALHFGIGFPDVVDLLLKAGASATITNSNGTTPLHLAVARADTNIAARLLEKGADPNAEDTDGATPFYRSLGNVGMVRLLIAKGADVNRRHVIKSGGQTMSHYPLMFVVGNGQDEVVDVMLEAKADLKVINRGLTPLLVAMNVGRVALVERLLRAGADPNFSPPNAALPLFKAAFEKSPEIVAALLKHGADPNFVNQQGFTPLYGISNPEILQLLLDHKADPNKGINPVTELLHPGDYLRATMRNVGVPPGNSQVDIYPAVEVLLKGGANPNATFSDGKRLLTFAVSNRDEKLVRLLLKHGAEVNYVANDETPLSQSQIAARDPRYVTGYPEQIEAWERIEKMLREHGANEFLQRLSTVSYTRPAWTSGLGKTVFSRGTNDYNRHTLFEMLTAVFTGGDQPFFPDLSRVTIERLEGANPKKKEIAVDIDELLRGGDCSNDMWLEWGDRISFPETDHPLNESWPGFAQETFDVLTKCLTRRVSIIVKQETNLVKLVPNWSPRVILGGGRALPNMPMQPGIGGAVVRPARPPSGEAPSKAKAEKMLSTFRLKEVVYAANVLRASSDPTRVRVARPARGDGKADTWTVDLTKVLSSNESGGGRLPSIQDLWLRDGDVVEIPEKP